MQRFPEALPTEFRQSSWRCPPNPLRSADRHDPVHVCNDGYFNALQESSSLFDT